MPMHMPKINTRYQSINEILTITPLDTGGGLNFCMQWHLCKFLILGDVYNHLFGLVFPCPTSKKMRVGVIGLAAPPPPPPLPPSVVLRWDFLKLCPLKNILKLCSGTFYICFCLEIHRHPLGNLALRFLHEI